MLSDKEIEELRSKLVTALGPQFTINAWSLFAAAAMSTGKSAELAALHADDMVHERKRRVDALNKVEGRS